MSKMALFDLFLKETSASGGLTRENVDAFHKWEDIKTCEFCRGRTANSRVSYGQCPGAPNGVNAWLCEECLVSEQKRFEREQDNKSED